MPPSFFNDVGRETLASQPMKSKGIETIMAHSSWCKKERKLDMRERRAFAAQLVELEKRATNCVKFKRAAEWNPILRTDWRKNFLTAPHWSHSVLLHWVLPSLLGHFAPYLARKHCGIVFGQRLLKCVNSNINGKTDEFCQIEPRLVRVVLRSHQLVFHISPNWYILYNKLPLI